MDCTISRPDPGYSMRPQAAAVRRRSPVPALLTALIAAFAVGVTLPPPVASADDGPKVEDVVERYDDGTVKARYTRVDGEIHGKCTRYYADGRQEFAGTYVRGRLDGPARGYYTNGNLRYDVTFKEGYPSGTYTEYHSDGKTVKTTGDAVGGLRNRFELPRRNGEWKSYDADGVLREKAAWNDGNRHGITTTYYSNGEMYYDVEFEDGVLRGVWRKFWSNGNLQAYGDADGGVGRNEYRMPTAHGNWTYYYKNGEIEKEVSYNKGLLQGRAVFYYDNGEMKIDVDFTDGRMDGLYEEYWPNGNPRRSGELAGNQKNQTAMLFATRRGLWLYYDRDGRLEYEREYKDDELHGRVVQFNMENGATLRSAVYEEGELNGPWRVHWDNGTIRRAGTAKGGTFTAPHKTGTWSAFRADGTPESTEIYKENKRNGRAFYFHEAGRPARVTVEWADDFVTGTYTETWPNGKTRVSGRATGSEAGSYALDTLTKDGEWKWWNEAGNPTKLYTYDGGILNGSATIYHDNGTPEIVANYTDGELSGMWAAYWPKGVIATGGEAAGSFFGDIREPKKTGTWTVHREDGTLEETSQYKDGYRNGVATLHTKDESVWIRATFADGVLTGEYIEYYTSGKVSKRGPVAGTAPDDFFAYVKQGTWNFYNDDGSKRLTADFVDDKYHGTLIAWYANGNRQIEAECADDAPAGTWRSFREDGSKWEEGNARGGPVHDPTRHGIWRWFDEAGRLTATLTWVNDKLDGPAEAFAPTGAKAASGVFRNGKLIGRYVGYHDDGSRREAGFVDGSEFPTGSVTPPAQTLTHPLREGPWQEFYRSGQISGVGRYKSNQKVGLWLTYRPDGTVRGARTHDGLGNSKPIESHTAAVDEDGVTTLHATNPDGSQTRVRYDKDGKLLSREVVPADEATASVTDAATGETVRLRPGPDGATEMTRETAATAEDGTRRLTTVAADGTTRERIARPDGRREAITSRPNGASRRIVTGIGSGGGTTRRIARTPDGRTETATREPDGTIVIERRDPADGGTASVRYRPGGGRDERTVDGTRIETRPRDDGNGWIEVTTRPDGTTERAVYDAQGRRVPGDAREEADTAPGRRYFEEVLGGRDWNGLDDATRSAHADAQQRLADAGTLDDLAARSRLARREAHAERRDRTASELDTAESELGDARPWEGGADGASTGEPAVIDADTPAGIALAQIEAGNPSEALTTLLDTDLAAWRAMPARAVVRLARIPGDEPAAVAVRRLAEFAPEAFRRAPVWRPRDGDMVVATGADLLAALHHALAGDARDTGIARLRALVDEATDGDGGETGRIAAFFAAAPTMVRLLDHATGDPDASGMEQALSEVGRAVAPRPLGRLVAARSGRPSVGAAVALAAHVGTDYIAATGDRGRAAWLDALRGQTDIDALRATWRDAAAGPATAPDELTHRLGAQASAVLAAVHRADDRLAVREISRAVAAVDAEKPAERFALHAALAGLAEREDDDGADWTRHQVWRIRQTIAGIDTVAAGLPSQSAARPFLDAWRADLAQAARLFAGD
jgi:antitoxin component YwqK of YwqJK toxin-antitoxin module